MVFTLFMTITCSSDSDDNLIPVDITYTNTVKDIIDNNCLNCHSSPPVNDAPMALISYENVKIAVQNLGLIGQVESGAMPQNASKLSEANIKGIKDWQIGGFKE